MWVLLFHVTVTDQRSGESCANVMIIVHAALHNFTTRMRCAKGLFICIYDRSAMVNVHFDLFFFFLVRGGLGMGVRVSGLGVKSVLFQFPVYVFWETGRDPVWWWSQLKRVNMVLSGEMNFKGSNRRVGLGFEQKSKRLGLHVALHYVLLYDV